MRAALFPVLAFLLAGCSLLLGPPESEAKHSSGDLFDAPTEAVWNALSEAYPAVGLEITEMDSVMLVLASSRAVNIWGFHVGPDRAPHARCVVPRLNRTLSAAATPGISPADVPVSLPPGRILLTIESVLVPQGSATRVETRMILSPIGLHADPSQDPYCVSTGRLEARISSAVRWRVGSSAEPLARSAHPTGGSGI